MDPNVQQQIADRLKEANNVLVTVSNNPSVDQLAACIGLTLLLNKLGKHATAVFSGNIPSTIEFLKPEETIEKNTDSLRDFIIALDKSKADKLRYKVEDKVVKIFITPYRTSITDKDLDFSQGDFNVDVVMALGVHERTELDQAITAHGRILHDATVISVNNRDQGSLGAVNWVDLKASSLSEMIVGLSRGLSTEPMDGQMATAFMTGIVAETNRFSNDKTSPITMNLASELMSAGANQQLIVAKLEEAPVKGPSKGSDDTDAEVDADGALQITHTDPDTTDEVTEAPVDLPAVVEDDEDTDLPEPPAEDAGEPEASEEPEDRAEPGPQISKLRANALPDAPAQPVEPAPAVLSSPNMALQPPTMGGKLTANTEPEHTQLDPSVDPLTALSTGVDEPLLTHSTPEPAAPTEPAEPISPPKEDAIINSESLSKLESEVGSPHVAEPAAPATGNLDTARDAVSDAINSSPDQPLEPVVALGSQPLGTDLRTDVAEPAAPAPTMPDFAAQPAVGQAPAMPDFMNPTPAPAASEPPAPYFPPTEPATPAAPAAGPIDFSNPPAPAQPPVGQGINPNIPSQLFPTTPPLDTTAAPASPAAPPPVPPPMVPPTPGNFGTPGI